MALGRQIQAYVKAKAERSALLPQTAACLDQSLRARVDRLGVDDAELLRVPAEAVVARIAELEAEAEREDSGLRPPRRRNDWD
jgi:hypothetical protein